MENKRRNYHASIPKFHKNTQRLGLSRIIAKELIQVISRRKRREVDLSGLNLATTARADSSVNSLDCKDIQS